VETSALSGKNVAQLIFNKWMKDGEEAIQNHADWDFKPLHDQSQQEPLKAKL